MIFALLKFSQISVIVSLYDSFCCIVEENFFGLYHWVAILDRKIVGFLMGISLTMDGGLKLLVDLIIVSTKHQKQTIGTKLWETAIKQVKKDKLRGVKFLTNQKNT